MESITTTGKVLTDALRQCLAVAARLGLRCRSVDLRAEDTLPQWLHWRFGYETTGIWLPRSTWDELPPDEQLFWEHEAAAVRRAVERGGFKTSS